MRNKKGWFRFLINVPVILLLSACSQAQQGEKSLAPTRVDNASRTPQLLLSATHTIRPPQLTFNPTSTPALQLKVSCPIPSSHATIQEAGTGSEAEQVVLDYLDQGGSPEQLQKEIKKLGAILDSSQVFTTDINGDGINEVVLAINFAPPRSGSYLDMHGDLFIYNCADSKYDVTKVIAGEEAESIEILAVKNLLDSDVPEILVSRKWFYMSSCEEFVELYSSTKQGWVSSFKTDESPCAMKIKLKDESNGRKVLVIEGSRGCSYSSCGPARGRKWTYEFEGNAVKLIGDELLPSPYRIHVLEDGEIAIEKGNLETAIKIYDKAARDNSLIDVLTTDEQDKQTSQNIPLKRMQQIAHDYQTSFAYFREFVLLSYLDRDDEVERIFNQIKVAYPQGKSGNEFVDISSYFLDQIKSGSSAKESCEATNEYLAKKYILSANDFIYPHLNGWGDLSPQIGELLCPVLNLH
jgi:hypothetical protein